MGLGASLGRPVEGLLGGPLGEKSRGLELEDARRISFLVSMRSLIDVRLRLGVGDRRVSTETHVSEYGGTGAEGAGRTGRLGRPLWPLTLCYGPRNLDQLVELWADCSGYSTVPFIRVR